MENICMQRDGDVYRGDFDVMYRVYDLIVYMIENCVLCILYLDMIINKKKLFYFYKFICLFSSVFNMWIRMCYGNFY